MEEQTRDDCGNSLSLAEFEAQHEKNHLRQKVNFIIRNIDYDTSQFSKAEFHLLKKSSGSFSDFSLLCIPLPQIKTETTPQSTFLSKSYFLDPRFPVGNFLHYSEELGAHPSQWGVLLSEILSDPNLETVLIELRSDPERIWCKMAFKIIPILKGQKEQKTTKTETSITDEIKETWDSFLNRF